ncbi:probable beta-D-xylosidase 7 isoform X3 [Haliotis rufescens]|uniref:probable beta-D-xylosidase 7 isoform X3 n=1 Tax=Haliotis rufescens TaxID=6454 RepID=UPI001EB0964A|nr:probable beta-D-xylosidase 7 isoform X3 [Haliotis rufescens]
MTGLRLLVVLVFVLPSHGDFPFRNTSLSWDERVDDLVGRLSIEEIMYQMTKGGTSPGNGPTPPIPRLGIGPYSWNTECLRGDVEAGNATSFPQSLGLAAAWDPDVVYKVAEATSEEVRGKFNDFVKNKQYGTHKGISCFSPVINIMRDPRWGRNEETYGEDPHLTGQYAAHFVWGLQGNHPRYVRANAGCKHFDAYAGPESIPVSRMSFNAVVSERDWRTTFLPAFRTCVKAGTYNIMCSYNSINGVPACANKRLLTDILRDEWGFQGYVVSDQGAIENIIGSHHYLNNSVDTVAACVNAGCNLELAGKAEAVYLSMLDAVKQGKLTEDLMRERVKKLFYTRMRLGEFDPPSMNPYSTYDLSYVESAAHRELAVWAATRTFVLLKNDGGFLPLKQKIDTIGVVGVMTFEGNNTVGNYAPNTDPRFMSRTIDGLRTLGNVVQAASGCNDSMCEKYDAAAIKKAVTGVDVLFITLGTGASIEKEGHDKPDIELPAGQVQLLKDAVQYSGNVPIVLLLFNAGPLNMTFAVGNPRIVSIMEVFYPAQATGEALRRVLTNDGGNNVPAGRLPYTWPRSLDGFPEMVNYSMDGRTYRYFNTEVLYPFGYGLSYSTFFYKEVTYPGLVKAGQSANVTTVVVNNGPYAADEVVQLYVRWESPSVPTPKIQLVDFKRVSLAVKQELAVNLTITAQNMAIWDDNNGWIVEDGYLEMFVGGQQPNQVPTVPSNIMSGSVLIDGTVILGKY